MELNITKPVVFFDLETTGVQVGADHIVQICLLKVLPDGTDEVLTRLVRPVDQQGNTLAIPAESTAIHRITDAMVAKERSFPEMAQEINTFIGDADLAGFNSNRFDVPMLVEEFLRAGVPFSLKGRRLIDVQNIFHKMEQRTLVAAYRFYCGKQLEGAHSADADTRATYEVLKAQLDRYKDTPFVDHDGQVSYPVQNDMEQLSRFSTTNQCADLVGHIGYNKAGKPIFNFGKYKGQTVEEVFRKEPAYFDWMVKADFPLSTKEVVKEIFEQIRQERQQRRERAEQEQADKLQQLKMHFEGR
ncbi:MAG: 3'-5' exonuclease [Bacteroidales bacterium]|nr:3'-5' exonuclease [Bacteroidales bacterium]